MNPTFFLVIQHIGYLIDDAGAEETRNILRKRSFSFILVTPISICIFL